MKHVAWLVAVAIWVAVARGDEPGVAESREKAQAGSVPTTWARLKVEARGVWFARNDLELGREKIAEAMEKLAQANFNEVLIDCWFRGVVAWPGSKLVPQYEKFKGEDPFGYAVEQAHARGLKAAAWVSYGFYAYHTPDATKDKSMGALLDAHPKLSAVDKDGNKFLHNPALGDFYSLCPSNPKSHELLGELMVEVITKYPVDTLHLDRIRYPEANYCYCDYCREHFKGDEKEFLAWKREQTAAAVKHFAEVARNARPGIRVTSYVVGPAEMDSRGQSWDLWVKRGLLDAVAVSMYGPDISQAGNRAMELLGGPEKLICAISAERPTANVLANVAKSRGISSLGQYVWFYGAVGDDLEALKAGPYAEPAGTPVGR